MTLGTAVLVLVLALIGIELAHKYMREKRKERIICVVLLSLLALACVAYIGLTLILVDAVRNQPPTP
ncbi:MAG: hypothetical protein SOY73_05890 [Blautia sp.]|nr:hypothetical protein [Blautia sp.]